jgi:hypothetical protein
MGGYIFDGLWAHFLFLQLAYEVSVKAGAKVIVIKGN